MLHVTKYYKVSNFSFLTLIREGEQGVWRLERESDCPVSTSGFGWVVSGDRTVEHRVLPVLLPRLLPLVEETADADQNHHDNHTDDDDDEANTHLKEIYS